MEATRIELAVNESDWLAGGDGDEYSCDDVRTAWLCAELHRGPTGVKGSFEAVWFDR